MMVTGDGISDTDIRFTLCFLTWEDRVLMLHRNKAPNRGLWNGVGGKIKLGEDPHGSCLREVREETGFQMDSLRFSGLLTWKGFEIPPGGIYLFHGKAPNNHFIPCDEGTLDWKPRSWAFSADEVVSNIHVFLPVILQGGPPQVFHFEYEDGVIQSYRISPLPTWLEVAV